MARGWGFAWKSLLVVACIAYQWALHSAVVAGGGGPTSHVLAYAPLVVLACWVLLRYRHKLVWLGALAAAAGMIYLMQRDPAGLAAAYGIPHAAINLLLLGLFASTLGRGREPLITRLARRVHGTLTPLHEAYTRKLTVFWCVYFAVQVLVSCLLFAFAPLWVWSLFVNLLNVPLLVLAFVGEYLFRVSRFPQLPHVSIAQAVRAFSKDASYANRAEAR